MKLPVTTIGKPRRSSSFERQDRAGFLLLVPMLIVFLGFIVYPLFSSIHMSLTNKVVGRDGVFVGLANYGALLKSPTFQRTIVNNFVYTFLNVAGKFFFGMVISLLLNNSFRGRSLVRGLLLLPWAIPALVSTLTWRWIYNDIGGILSYVLKSMGVIDTMMSFLAAPQTAFVAVCVVSIWRGTPFFAMSLLAGLQAIPRDLYEAARIDGANRWQIFRNIEWPGLLSVCSVILILDTIWTFNEFLVVNVLTRGGPLNSTMLFSVLTYQIGIGSLKLGEAAACSLMFLPLIALMIYFGSKYLLKED